MVIDDFMQIIETLIESDMMTQAEDCISKMESYYELVADRGNTFLVSLPIKRFSQEIQGLIYRCRADIIRFKDRERYNLEIQKLYEKALFCFKECGSVSGIAYVKNAMGLNYLWNYRDRKKALECFEESEKYSRNYGYDMCLAETLKNKGVLLTNEFGKNEEAQVCYEEAELLYKKIGDDRGIAHVTKRMGVIEWNNGEVDLAIEY